MKKLYLLVIIFCCLQMQVAAILPFTLQKIVSQQTTIFLQVKIITNNAMQPFVCGPFICAKGAYKKKINIIGLEEIRCHSNQRNYTCCLIGCKVCKGVKKDTSAIRYLQSPISVPAIEPVNPAFAYPNPTMEQVNLQVQQPVKQVLVYTTQGNIIRRYVNPNQLQFYVADFPKGIYLFSIYTTEKVEVIKVEKL